MPDLAAPHLVDALLAGADVPELAACRRVIIVGRVLSLEQLVRVASCRHLTSLEELRLFDVGFDDEGARAFANACTLEQLTSLYCPWNRLGPAGLFALLKAPALRKLESLHLYRNELGPEGMRVLVEAAPRLRMLNACFNGLGVEGARTLAAWNAPAPQVLHLGVNALGDEGLAALCAAEGLRGVQELNVKANGLGPASLGSLTRAALWGSLERFLGEDNAFAVEGARALEAAPDGRLKVLQLGGAGIGGAGARALANASSLRALESLSLSSNSLGDSGLERLADAAFANGLTHLDVSDNQLGDAGARVLIDRWPRLRELRARENGFGSGARASLLRVAASRPLSLQT